MSEPPRRVSLLPSVSLDVIGEDPVASAALSAYRSLAVSLGLEGLEVEATKTKFVAGTSRALFSSSASRAVATVVGFYRPPSFQPPSMVIRPSVSPPNG